MDYNIILGWYIYLTEAHASIREAPLNWFRAMSSEIRYTCTYKHPATSNAVRVSERLD